MDFGHVGDFRIVRGDDHPIDGGALFRRVNGPGDEGLSAQEAHVLAGNAPGSAPGGDDSDGPRCGHDDKSLKMQWFSAAAAFHAGVVEAHAGVKRPDYSLKHIPNNHAFVPYVD